MPFILVEICCQCGNMRFYQLSACQTTSVLSENLLAGGLKQRFDALKYTNIAQDKNTKHICESIIVKSRN